MSRILFLDIDGPMIPSRAYVQPGQTTPIVKNFDQCAVGMINAACRKTDRKIVIHSSWIRSGFWKTGEDGDGDVIDHCISQGILREYFHEDWCCNRDISWRYDRINEYLGRHPEVGDYVILDDEPCKAGLKIEPHLLIIDFENGITMKDFNRLKDGNWIVK